MIDQQSEDAPMTDFNMAVATLMRLDNALKRCNVYSSERDYNLWFNSGLSVLYREMYGYFSQLKSDRPKIAKELFEKCMLLNHNISNKNNLKVNYPKLYQTYNEFEIILREIIIEMKFDFPRKDKNLLGL